ncbi:MAG: hypothetical protein P4L84_28075 [Isosphaeraceae bacterium]|nr:hypothetical protein [Isosphaeraceae bacterium]
MPAQNLADLLFPARDASFGPLVSALSEPPNGPHADNLVSNEDSYPRVAGEIDRRAPKDCVYLGVGPDQNFTLIAHTRPKLAFVVDYRRRNLLLHLIHKAFLSLGADRTAYLTRLTARRPERLPPNPTAAELVAAFTHVPLDRGLLEKTTDEVAAALRPCGLVRDEEWAELATIQAKLAGPGMNARFLALTMYPTFGRLIQTPDRDGKPAHFLAREELYQSVRALQLGDRLLPLTGDFAGPTALPRLADWLRGHRLTVGVVYVSDVEFFLRRSGKFDAYVANLGRLPWAEGAVLVRTSTREIDHPERVPGDSATTLVRPVAAFVAEPQGELFR